MILLPDGHFSAWILINMTKGLIVNDITVRSPKPFFKLGFW